MSARRRTRWERLTPVQRKLAREAKLAKVINARHVQSERAGGTFLLAAIRAGRQLAYVKKQLDHGEFEEWVQEYCPKISLRTVRRYRQVATKLWPRIKVKVGNRPHVAGLESVRQAFTYVEQLETGYTVKWPYEDDVAQVLALLDRVKALGGPGEVIILALERLADDFENGLVQVPTDGPVTFSMRKEKVPT